MTVAEYQALKQMNSTELHQSNLQLAQQERVITERLLWQLREVERRRLYLDHGVSSLHAYCVRILKYSDGAASRRVNASRLLEQLPEMANKIVDGSLNLSNLAMAQTFLRSQQKLTGERFSREQIESVVTAVENKSHEEATRELFELMPEAPVGKSVKVILAHGETEFRISADGEFMQMYERLQEIHAHKGLTARDLFKLLMKQELNRKDPLCKQISLGNAASECDPDVYPVIRTRRFFSSN